MLHASRSIVGPPALLPRTRQERLTLKHRNTSRWARRAIKRGQTLMDEGTREAVADQLRLGEELRKRVRSSSSELPGREGEGGRRLSSAWWFPPTARQSVHPHLRCRRSIV